MPVLGGVVLLLFLHTSASSTGSFSTATTASTAISGTSATCVSPSVWAGTKNWLGACIDSMWPLLHVALHSHWFPLLLIIKIIIHFGIQHFWSFWQSWATQTFHCHPVSRSNPNPGSSSRHGIIKNIHNIKHVHIAHWAQFLLLFFHVCFVIPFLVRMQVKSTRCFGVFQPIKSYPQTHLSKVTFRSVVGYPTGMEFGPTFQSLIRLIILNLGANIPIACKAIVNSPTCRLPLWVCRLKLRIQRNALRKLNKTCQIARPSNGT